MKEEESNKAKPLELVNKIVLELDENDQLNIDLKNKSLPLKLYKYYEINDYSIDSFENNSIFMTHPDDLNDTMEGNLKLWDFDNLFEMYKEDTGNKSISIDEFKKDSFNKYRDEYFGYRGVFCLTKSYQNNLFWPHYTNEKGFCIEFFSNDFIKSIDKKNEHIKSKYVYPVSYQDLTKIDLLKYCSFKTLEDDYKNFNSSIPSIYTIAIKDKIWRYEHEWRIIAKSNISLKDNSYRKLKYEEKSISRIFLAERFFSKDRFHYKKIDKNSKKFYFSHNHKDYNNLLIFIKEIYQKYNSKTYIIGRIEKGNVIEKDIEFQVVIKKFDIHSVEVEFRKG